MLGRMSITFACDDANLQWRWSRAQSGLTTTPNWLHGERFLTDGDLLANLLADDIIPGVAVAALRAALRRRQERPLAEVPPLAAIAYEVWQRTHDPALLADAYAAGIHDLRWLERKTEFTHICMLYATQRALIALAAARADTAGANYWRQRSALTCSLLMANYYRPAEAYFFDDEGQPSLLPLLVDAVDPPTFQRIWQRHFATARQRRTALDAALALPLPRWLERAGKLAAQSELLHAWLDTPLMESTLSRLRLSEAIARLHGIHRHTGGWAWNCRPLRTGGRHRYHLHAAGSGDLVIEQQPHTAELHLNGALIAQVSGTCRVITDNRGRVAGIVGSAATTVAITLACDGATQQLMVESDGLALL